jgi:nephron
MEFSTPPLPIQHLQQTAATGNGTLRRGIRGIVPPPDVTHHTTHTSKSTHNLHDTSSQNGTSHLMNNVSNLSSQTSTPKPPQGILKDPKRNQQQLPNNMQILNVQNAAGLGGNLLIGAFDPANTNLSSFNASLGYTDADGHLV